MRPHKELAALRMALAVFFTAALLRLRQTPAQFFRQAALVCGVLFELGVRRFDVGFERLHKVSGEDDLVLNDRS